MGITAAAAASAVAPVAVGRSSVRAPRPATAPIAAPSTRFLNLSANIATAAAVAAIAAAFNRKAAHLPPTPRSPAQMRVQRRARDPASAHADTIAAR